LPWSKFESTVAEAQTLAQPEEFDYLALLDARYSSVRKFAPLLHAHFAIVANVYLEGTYSEIYPHISQDTVGLRRLFRQFSTPGGIPSHASVQTPGSINSHKGFLSESELQETSDSPKDWPDSYCCGTAKSFADAGGPLQKTLRPSAKALDLLPLRRARDPPEGQYGRVLGGPTHVAFVEATKWIWRRFPTKSHRN